MKVTVLGEESNNTRKSSNKKSYFKLSLFSEWLISMFGYAIVLLIASSLFEGFYVKNIGYALIGSILIFIFNKTLKPILIYMSLPLIGVTLGIFYFVINVFILYLVDLILGSGFEVVGMLSPIIISMFISLLNLITQKLIIKPIIERYGN